MRTIIAGSRTITDYSFIQEAMEDIPWDISGVVHGGARGVDRLGEQWGEENGQPTTLFKADWKQYDKAAGYIRNEEMAKNAEALIAFWDKKSKGTKHMIDIAIRYGLYIKVFYV